MKKLMHIQILALLAFGMTGCPGGHECMYDMYDDACLGNDCKNDCYGDGCTEAKDWDSTYWDKITTADRPYFCTEALNCTQDNYGRWGTSYRCELNFNRNAWDCPPGFWKDEDYLLDDNCASNPESCQTPIHACDGEFCHDDFIDSADCIWDRVCDENNENCKWYSEGCAQSKFCMNGICYHDYENINLMPAISCTQDSDCGTDMDSVCVYNVCRLLMCKTHADCPQTHTCLYNVCYNTGENSNPDNNTPSVEPECTQNADCGENMLCTDGRCIPCKNDACDTSQEIECVFSSQCDSQLCVNGVCLEAGSCVVDDNCEEGHVCLNGFCVIRPECLEDSECGEGRICNADNKCEDDVECREDIDCGVDMICVQNMCAQCRLNCECPEGNICMNGACVTPE